MLMMVAIIKIMITDNDDDWLLLMALIDVSDVDSGSDHEDYDY